MLLAQLDSKSYFYSCNLQHYIQSKPKKKVSRKFNINPNKNIAPQGYTTCITIQSHAESLTHPLKTAKITSEKLSFARARVIPAAPWGIAVFTLARKLVPAEIPSQKENFWLHDFIPVPARKQRNPFGSRLRRLGSSPSSSSSEGVCKNCYASRHDKSFINLTCDNPSMSQAKPAKFYMPARLKHVVCCSVHPHYTASGEIYANLVR